MATEPMCEPCARFGDEYPAYYQQGTDFTPVCAFHLSNEWFERRPRSPENCPDPRVHGTFRYCPYCSWVEPDEGSLNVQMRTDIETSGVPAKTVEDGRTLDEQAAWVAQSAEYVRPWHMECIARNPNTHRHCPYSLYCAVCDLDDEPTRSGGEK